MTYGMARTRENIPIPTEAIEYAHEAELTEKARRYIAELSNSQIDIKQMSKQNLVCLLGELSHAKGRKRQRILEELRLEISVIEQYGYLTLYKYIGIGNSEKIW